MLCTVYNYTVFFVLVYFHIHVFVSAGNSGVVREGLTNPLIPNGWNWGGVVSDHCPVWVEFYVGKDLDIADLSAGAEAIKFTLGTEGWTTKFHLHLFFFHILIGITFHTGFFYHIENSCHNFNFGSCEQNFLLVFKLVVYQFVFRINMVTKGIQCTCIFKRAFVENLE